MVRELSLADGIRFPARCPSLVRSDPSHAPRAPGSAPFLSADCCSARGAGERVFWSLPPQRAWKASLVAFLSILLDNERKGEGPVSEYLWGNGWMWKGVRIRGRKTYFPIVCTSALHCFLQLRLEISTSNFLMISERSFKLFFIPQKCLLPLVLIPDIFPPFDSLIFPDFFYSCLSHRRLEVPLHILSGPALLSMH